MPELIQISFSPWSEKARWALDACGVRYETREYLPLFGELELRRLLRRYRGPVTVPLLRDGERVFSDSYTIACYAAARTAAATLFPRGQEARIAHYDALSERGMAAARALGFERMLTSRAALRAILPRPLGRAPLPVAAVLGRSGVLRTMRKYATGAASSDEHRRILSEVLDTLRADLAASPSRAEPKTLLEEFSYADIAMAQVVYALRLPPVSLRLPRAMRAAFEDPALAACYPDLVTWRDALYARHRAASA